MTIQDSKLIQIGLHSVPGLWRRLLPEDFFYLKFPDESNATCGNCPQIKARDFTPPHKCCTYFPLVPNFMLGMALRDSTSRERVLALGEGGFATLEGSHISPSAYRLSLEENARGLFGKTPKVKCSFMNKADGMCTIYPYRNSVCSTFFCDNLHGVRGALFWEKVQGFVGQIETALSQWCMESLGVNLEDYFQVYKDWSQDMDAMHNEATGAWSQGFLKELHGEWYGRESEFLLACGDLVSSYEGDLYQVAALRKIHDNWHYDVAFQEWLPDEAREEFEDVPDQPGDAIPVADLWYELKLNHKQLWDIPFNEGPFVLDPSLKVQANNREDALGMHFEKRSHKIVSNIPGGVEGAHLLVTETEAEALRLFTEPVVLDSELLEEPSFKKLADGRAFLSYLLRKGWIKLAQQ